MDEPPEQKANYSTGTIGIACVLYVIRLPNGSPRFLRTSRAIRPNASRLYIGYMFHVKP